jgi:adenylosuccinate synthase
VDEHNRGNPWQGEVRYGAFDAVLARYALEVVGGVDVLALTHLDALARWPSAPVCGAYRVPPEDAEEALVAERNARGEVERLTVAGAPSLARLERLGALLGRARAVLEHLPPHAPAFLCRLEELLGRRVDVVSRGPRAADVCERP